jgi:hypothetical protein
VRALLDGFRSLGRNAGLVPLVLLLNLGLGLVVALPLSVTLWQDLSHTGASTRMMDGTGIDFEWWSRFDANARGFSRDFTPDLVGTGFALRNLDLLLRGAIPAGLFSRFTGTAPLLLGLGALYWLLQLFLTGGLIAVLRAPSGGWTFRGFVHGCGFHFGRLLRVALLALAAAAVVFAGFESLAAWTDAVAREAVSERTALGLLALRAALLLAALVAVHMASSYAKVILVCDERRSAVMAFASSLGFCVRNLVPALVQYAVVASLGVALVAVFGFFDARLRASGWTTQLVALALFEAFVAARIALRLGLLAGQVELQQAGPRR